jgi:hypothetical protein
MPASNGPNTVTSGLVFCLDAANIDSYRGSGTSWNDLGPNERNGSLIGGPTYSTANLGSIVFDGVDDYSSHGELPGIFSSFTVSVWFYSTSVTNYKNVIDCNFGYNSTTGNIGPRLEMDSAGVLRWAYSNITNSNPTYYNHNVVASGLAANVWHNASITYDGSTNSSSTFYNGNSTNIARNLFGSPTGFIGIMSNVIVGKGFSLVTTSERVFQGRVSSVSIYNRPLTPAEISQNFNAVRSRYGV